jgi:hypothetical protein
MHFLYHNPPFLDHQTLLNDRNDQKVTFRPDGWRRFDLTIDLYAIYYYRLRSQFFRQQLYLFIDLHLDADAPRGDHTLVNPGSFFHDRNPSLARAIRHLVSPLHLMQLRCNASVPKMHELIKTSDVPAALSRASPN